MSKKAAIDTADEDVTTRIFALRGRKVMIDSDLAVLYGVPTKRLNEQVKRNRKRFPPDFMFQLSRIERSILIENHEHLNKLKFSSKLPFAFTGDGAVALANVLNSDRAIRVYVEIVRSLFQMRKSVYTSKDILGKSEEQEQTSDEYDEDIQLILRYLNELLNAPDESTSKIWLRNDSDR